jgi:hypothetical protein
MMNEENANDLRVLIARVDAKLDSLLQLTKRQALDLGDHESRIRELERMSHSLATRDDIEAIEARRDAEQTDRSRKLFSVIGVAMALVVPVEAAFVTWLVTQLSG